MPPAFWGALLRAESEQAITTFIDELGVTRLALSDNDLTYDVLGPNELEINNQKVKKGRGWSALLTTTQAQRSKLQSCLNQVVVSRAGKSLPVVSLQVNPLSID
jgi:hypothetical protein